jgi:hypothetical protein
MPSSKTILKKASRRRGSVSLKRVRRAVDTVLAQNIREKNLSSAQVRNARQRVRIANAD